MCSKPNAQFMTMGLANFYLGTPQDCPEYVQIQINVTPQEFIDKHDHVCFAHNGWVYFEFSKDLYGLKQSGKLANNLLREWLQVHEY